MSSPTPRRSAGRGWGAGLALLCIGLLVMFAWTLRRRPPRPAPAPPLDTEEPQRASRDVHDVPALADTPAATPEDDTPLPPIVDQVRVEKQEVCEGEENLVTVKAHTPGGRDDLFLHYVVGSEPGQAVPVRAFLPPEGVPVPGPATVTVFGRDNVSTTVPIPHYTVKRCKPDRFLFVTVRQQMNTVEEFQVDAVIRETDPANPLKPALYKWTFGDGGVAETAIPTATHRFVPQNPDALYADFVVGCEAVDAQGHSVLGRTSFSLRNSEVENLHYKKAVVLSVELTPRFPELDAQGHVVQRVRLYHHRSTAVYLDRARITYQMSTSNGSPVAEEHTAAEVMGGDEVPPGQGLEAELRFDTTAHPGALMADYDLEGQMPDGTRAFAHFSLMRPPAPPTPEDGERVTDALLTAKILRARERLGKAFVNDEDLMQLERAGAFADLKAPEAASGATGAPAEVMSDRRKPAPGAAPPPS